MITLPWSDTTAPNVMLEITNECNLECQACYAKHGNIHKPITEVAQELEAAKRLRPIQMVTITGGEPMLHPELPQIIRMLSQSGVKTFLLTNGTLADKTNLQELKEAGLDDILFHVDTGQRRYDLPHDCSIDDVIEKQNELTDTAKSAGLDPSLSVTIYNEIPDQIINNFMNKSNATMLFLSQAKDPEDLPLPDPKLCDSLMRKMQRFCGASPFACIKADNSSYPPLWYSFFIPVRSCGNKRDFYPYCGTIADSLLIRLGHALTGRYTHRMPKSQALIRFRVLTNGILSHRIIKALKFNRYGKQPTFFHHKMIVYDDGPVRSPTGETVRCSFCPTAIFKGDRLIRVCELNNI